MSSKYSGNPANVAIPQLQTITGATNATPIVVTTSGNHLYNTGDQIIIAQVNGNKAANNPPNTPWTITVLSPTTFSLNGSSGSNAYVSGGLALNLTPNPPTTLPSDGDPSPVASVNVALQGLADKIAWLGTVQPSLREINEYTGGASDDTWSQWAGSSTLASGSGWSVITLVATPVGDLYNFASNIFGEVPRCNHGDVLRTYWQLGAVTSNGAIALAPAVQVSSDSNGNAFTRATGSAVACLAAITGSEAFGGTSEYVVSANGNVASITAFSGGKITIAGLFGMSSQSVGDTINLSGCASAGNNGAFTVTDYVSATSVKAANASGVAPDANNGSIAYYMTNMKFNVQIQIENISGGTRNWAAWGHRSMRSVHLRPQWLPPIYIWEP